MRLITIFLVVFCANLWASDQALEAPLAQDKDYDPLADRFDLLLRNFDINYPTLNRLSSAEKASAPELSQQDEKVFYFCTCLSMPHGLRSNGMAFITKRIEEKISGLNLAKLHLISVGAESAVTEFLLIDVLLERKQNLTVSIDLIDPVYALPEESTSGHIAGLLFKSLARKYPNRFLALGLRSHDFSLIEDDPEPLEKSLIKAQVFLPTSLLTLNRPLSCSSALISMALGQQAVRKRTSH